MPALLCLPNLGGGTVCFLQCQMRITCRTEALLIGLALLLTAIEPAVAIDNVVLQWNEATLDAIRNTKSAPPIAARAFSITHTAIPTPQCSTPGPHTTRWRRAHDWEAACAVLR